MAGKFRGQVSKIPKVKRSKAARKGKSTKIVALVKRSPKLTNTILQTRIAELTSSIAPTESIQSQVEDFDSKMAEEEHGDQAKESLLSLTSKEEIKRNRQLNKTEKSVTSKSVSRAKLNSELLDRKKGKQEVISAAHSSTKAAGLTMLRAAVKNQSHNRLLPHQNRHDYEYRLRNIATLGVVKLFNSLATAHKAGQAVLKNSVSDHLTQQKAIEKKEVLSRDAFLAALRQPQSYDGQVDWNEKESTELYKLHFANIARKAISLTYQRYTIS